MSRLHRRFQGWLWILLLTAVVPGFAWAAGTISGHVYQQDGSTPIPNISVNIYTDRCHNGHLSGTQTDTNGYFEFTELLDDQQFILRVDPVYTGPYYISQWYDGLNDQEDCNQATFVSVGETVIFRLDPGAAVSGIVRDSGGNLITGVSELVGVFSGDPCGSHQWYGGSWTELDDGAFTIVGIPAGTYFMRTCNAESDYIDTWWNISFGSESCAEAESFTVAAGQLASGFEFRLYPGGRITGRVTRESDGQPIANLWVEAHHYDSNAWGNGANTDDDGYYEITGLPGDDYRIFIYPGGMNYLEEYYDDSHDYSTASRVPVTAGGTTINIDMAMDYGFEHDASVMNIHQPDGSFKTYYSFYPDGFVGDPSVEIGSVTVLTPVSHTLLPLVWDPVWNEFALAIDGSPEAGVHVFTATTADGHVVVSTDYQYVIQTIPNPDTALFSPAEGAVVASKTPTFSWDPVDMPGVPLHYRFEVVDDATGLREWASGRNFGMTSITLNEGRLGPGSYRWRVRVTDSGDWLTVQNRANSDWIYFTVPDELDDHDALPAIDPNNWNGLTWIGGENFVASVKVTDLDGVAFDGSSHTVNVTPPVGAAFPDGSSVKYASFDSTAGPTACYYWLYVGGGTPVPGVYTFTVTDPDGNETSFVEQVDVNPLSNPDETSITPSNIDEYITATFDNVYVNGVLYENFNIANINQLDPSKWKWPSEAAIVDDKLQFDLHDFVGRGHGGISFTHIDPITTVQADTTVTSASDNRARAQIAGTFFNDGSDNDFWLQITNDGSNVSYIVERQWFNQEGNYQWETVQAGDLISASLNDVVTLGVSWNEGLKTLTFSATNQNTGASQSTDYVHSGPVYPPITNDLSLRTRINMITNSTPTFTWAPVAEANRYRVRIYNYDNSRTIWNGYTGSETSVTVPPGVLEPDSYYRFRLDAFDKPSPLGVDNYSRTPANFSDFYRFYTNSEIPQDPYIDLDGSGAQTIQSDESGVFPAFWVRVSDKQGVPGNIASVKVTYPGGLHEEFLYLDHTDSPYNGYYNAVSEQTAVPGTYTFTVTDRNGNTDTITDELVYAPIGYPVAGSLTATVGPMDILVNWDPVSGASFYRLEIYNEAYERIHRLTIDAGEGSSILVPRGLLEEGHLYRYRVRTYREFYSDITGFDSEGNFDNSSQIPWSPNQYPTFVISSVTGGAGDPIIELDNRGVYASHAWDPLLGQDAYFLEFQVKVTDVDGIPGNIDRVYATLPNSTTLDLTYDVRISDTEAYYYAYRRFNDIADITALEGNFTFTAVDVDGGSDTTAADNLSGTVANMLAVPSYLSPAPDAMLTSTTPTLSWASVAGADSYRVRLFTSWHSTLSWSDYIPALTTHWKVPYGLLEPGTTYAYRVYATRGGFPLEDLDFNSFNMLYYSWLPHFSISPTPDTDYDGILDAVEIGHACLDPQDADTDNDGLLDGIEDTNRDGFHDTGETNPCIWDTDDDGMPDGWEVNYGLNPLVADDNDDADGDLFTNYMEFLLFTNPRNVLDYPALSNGFDEDMDVDGLDLYHLAIGVTRDVFDAVDVEEFADAYGY